MKKKNILIALLIIGSSEQHIIKATEFSYGKLALSAISLFGLGYIARYCYQKLFAKPPIPANQKESTKHPNDADLFKPLSKHDKHIILLEGTKEDIDHALKIYTTSLESTKSNYIIAGDYQTDVNQQLFTAYKDSLSKTKIVFIPWLNNTQKELKLNFFNSIELGNFLVNSLNQDLQKEDHTNKKITQETTELIKKMSKYAYHTPFNERCFTIGNNCDEFLNNIKMYLNVYATQNNVSISIKTISKNTYTQIVTRESLGYGNETIFFIIDNNMCNHLNDNDYR